MSDQALNEAVIHEWAWKTPAMSRMTVAVVELALASARGESEIAEFSANDLPEELDHGGQGIAGSVFKWLKRDGIIARVRLADGNPKFVYNAGKNPVGVYRLQSEPLALELLSRHSAAPGPEPVAVQTEML